LNTLVKQGILKECWGDITKTEMSEILSCAVKMLAEAQHVSADKFKKLAKTLKIGSIKGVDKKGEGKTSKKAGKSTEEMIHETLEKLGEGIKELVNQSEVKAAAEKPVVQPEVKVETPASKPARPAKTAAKASGSVQQKKPTAETAATQLSNELAAMDLLDEARGKKK
jgi:hypothetical protein